jgi:TrmH family RNA methyltransferase
LNENKLKLIKNLIEKRSARRREGRFVVEGPHLVEEAIKDIDYVIYAEELPLIAKLEAAGVKCLKVTKKQFLSVTQVEAPQWVMAVVFQKLTSAAKLISPERSLLIYCLGVQDPGNLGAIIRTTDAVGATGLILSKGTVDLFNPKVIRSTMGSLFHIPIALAEDDKRTLKQLKEKNVKIVATTLTANNNYWQNSYCDSTVILIGNEGRGLSGEIQTLADALVKIPMPGWAESLNTSISAALILYEALRQRQNGKENQSNFSRSANNY